MGFMFKKNKKIYMEKVKKNETQSQRKRLRANSNAQNCRNRFILGHSASQVGESRI